MLTHLESLGDNVGSVNIDKEFHDLVWDRLHKYAGFKPEKATQAASAMTADLSGFQVAKRNHGTKIANLSESTSIKVPGLNPGDYFPEASIKRGRMNFNKYNGLHCA